MDVDAGDSAALFEFLDGFFGEGDGEDFVGGDF